MYLIPNGNDGQRCQCPEPMYLVIRMLSFFQLNVSAAQHIYSTAIVRVGFVGSHNLERDKADLAKKKILSTTLWQTRFHLTQLAFWENRFDKLFYNCKMDP